MRIFSDYHHFALGRSFLNAFCGRLGYEVWFADNDFFDSLEDRTQWGLGIFPDKGYIEGAFSPYRESWPRHGRISFERFKSVEIDAFICTRTESQQWIKDLRDKYHPHAALICQSGNEGARFDWDTFPNLMAADNFTFEGAPASVHKILMPQELGWYFGREFTPIDETNWRRIGTYINSFCSMTDVSFARDTYYDSTCPYCEREGAVTTSHSVYGYWQELRKLMPDVVFNLYGFENDEAGGRFLNEWQIIDALSKHSMSFQMKMHEGFGHAVCQSVAAGRPVIVPKRFFAHRLARRYLIPDTTCIEVDLENPKHAAEKVGEVLSDLSYLQSMCRQCYTVGQALFDWEWEALRLRRFMESLTRPAKPAFAKPTERRRFSKLNILRRGANG